MKSKRIFLKREIILFSLFFTLFFIFIQVNMLSVENEAGKIYVIPIKGTIDLGLSSFVQRILKEAELNQARAIILEIDTFGGRVDAAIQIRDKIINLRIPNVAYIQNKAWSAGALIALSAEYILMEKDSSIGAAEPRPADEKNISALKAEFSSTALNKGRSEKIAAAMVDKDIEIADIVEKGKILTLSAMQAWNNNFIDGVIIDFNEILTFLGLEDVTVRYTKLNWAEQISRLVTNPTVSSILLSLGFLGCLMEFMTVGWGIAGTLGVIALFLFFGGYMIVGIVGWEAVILLVIGLILIGLEIFVIPGFGIAGIFGILAIIASIVLTMGNVVQAAYSILIALSLTLIAFLILIKYLPSTWIWKKFILSTQQNKEQGYTVATHELNNLKEKEGITITPLRPSGIVKIYNQKLNVLTRGEYIDINVRVRVVNVEGNKIIVEAIEESKEKEDVTEQKEKSF